MMTTRTPTIKKDYKDKDDNNVKHEIINANTIKEGTRMTDDNDNNDNNDKR